MASDSTLAISAAAETDLMSVQCFTLSSLGYFGGLFSASAQEIRRRRRAPYSRAGARPDFRPLRLVMMPRPWIEIAKFLVFHLVELDEELDHLIVGIAM